jgi:hypothetical protein
MVQRNLASVIRQIETDLQSVRDQFLINVAEDLVNSSIPFVDTGAYITSHSITTTRGAGRSRTSHNKPTGQDPNAKAEESFSQLMGDIASLPPEQEVVYITNNAPHANVVEYKHGHNVYTSVRSRAKAHLQDAINRVRGTQ